MVEGLFLDGIDVGSNNLSVGISVQLALDVLPDAADAEFGVGNSTLVIAQQTMDHRPIDGFIEHGVFKHVDSGGKGALGYRIVSLEERCA
jgi:hypothetical protein